MYILNSFAYCSSTPISRFFALFGYRISCCYFISLYVRTSLHLHDNYSLQAHLGAVCCVSRKSLLSLTFGRPNEVLTSRTKSYRFLAKENGGNRTTNPKSSSRALTKMKPKENPKTAIEQASSKHRAHRAGIEQASSRHRASIEHIGQASSKHRAHRARCPDPPLRQFSTSQPPTSSNRPKTSPN